MLRPGKKLLLRSDVHGLWLTSSSDLWYSGGGAFQPWTFGFQGRPSNGHTKLANIYDISADYKFGSRRFGDVVLRLGAGRRRDQGDFPGE